jgi:putative endopeptidase
LDANLDQQLIKLIRDAAATGGDKGSPKQQIGDYYRAAMDTQRMDDLGLAPLAADLQQLNAISTPSLSGAQACRRCHRVNA